MPAPPKDIIALTAKLDRADELIFNLKVAWNNFAINDEAYPIDFADDPGSGDRIYRLAAAPPIPITVPILAGDAIQNLRSALDHLAYRLACVGTASCGPFNDVYFPIGQTAKKRKDKLLRIRKYLAPTAVTQLEKIEANESGSDEMFWHLHCLNNIDKHRLLLTVNSQSRLHSMPPSQVTRASRDFLGIAMVDPETTHRTFLTESPTPVFDVKRGDVLARVPRTELQEKMFFPFELAFGEPQAIKGEPVVHTLMNIEHRIRTYVMEFDRLRLL